MSTLHTSSGGDKPEPGPTPAQKRWLLRFAAFAEDARSLADEAWTLGFHRKHTLEAEWMRAVSFFVGAAERMLRDAREEGSAIVCTNGSPNGLDATPLLRLIPRPKPAAVIRVDFRARLRIEGHR